MPHFLAFAAEGLLYENDLCFLYNHLKTDAGERMDIENESNPQFSIFEEMMRLVTINVYNRIHDVLNRKPIILHDYGHDNIKKIRHSCGLLGINFSTACNHIIENELLAIEQNITTSYNNTRPMPYIYARIIAIISETKNSRDPAAWYFALNQIENIIKIKQRINRFMSSLSDSSNQAENKIEASSRKRKLPDDEKQEDSPSKEIKTTHDTALKNMSPPSLSTNNQEEPIQYLERNGFEYHFFIPANNTEMQIVDQLEIFEKIQFLAQTLRNDDTLEKINDVVRKTRAPHTASRSLNF